LRTQYFPETAVDRIGSVESVGILKVESDSTEICKESAAMGNPVVHFEIIGENQQLLNDFYGRVFDWKIEQVMNGYATVNTGSGIAGGIGAMGEARRHVTFYVEVADIQAALALIESKGGKPGFGPHSVPTDPSSAGSPILK
jgi:uncharacterized protein